MARDPLGISTGQGRGAAQVFGSTYNPTMRQQAQLNVEKKREFDRDLYEDLEAPGAWHRDDPIIMDKRNKLYEFTKENTGKLLNGDAETMMEFNRMKDDYKTIVKSSEDTKKQYGQLLSHIQKNSDDYTEDTIERIKTFGSKDFAGNFDISQIEMEKAFKDIPFKKDVASLVNNLKEDTSGNIYLGQNEAGYDIFSRDVKTNDEAARVLAKDLWNNTSGIRQKYQSEEEVHDVVRGFMKDEKKETIKSQYKGGDGDDSDRYNINPIDYFVENNVTTPKNVDGDINASIGTTVGFAHQDINTVVPVTFKTDVSNIPNVSVAYGTEAEGRDYDNLKKSLKGAKEWDVHSFDILPVFKQGTKVELTKEKGDPEMVDLSGIVAEKYMLDGFRGLSKEEVEDLISYDPMITMRSNKSLGDRVGQVDVRVPFDTFDKSFSNIYPTNKNKNFEGYINQLKKNNLTRSYTPEQIRRLTSNQQSNVQPQTEGVNEQQQQQQQDVPETYKKALSEFTPNKLEELPSNYQSLMNTKGFAKLFNRARRYDENATDADIIYTLLTDEDYLDELK